MNFLRKIKKGFTIVELVIVIAVIAILTAILVPTFINISKKANQASDQSLVKNLNTALKIVENDPELNVNGDNKTMHDAVEDLDAYGYDLSKLVTKSDEKILWNQDDNQFYFEKNQNSRSYWKIVNTVAEAESETVYSVYARQSNNFDGKTVNAQTGFDAGYNSIKKVSYVRTSGAGQKVAIRTNGGELFVNAPNDEVKHYGLADGVDIKAIKATSFHEFATSGFIKLETGRLVVEEEAVIEGIFLVANENGDFDDIKLAVVGDAVLPEVARSDVDLNEGESKLVVEVQTLATSEGTDPNPEFVWITGGASAGEVSVTVSDTSNPATFDDDSHVVADATPAAAVVSDAVEESAEPVTDNSICRINAIGYESFKAAVEAAKLGEKIYLLKSFTLDETIGRYADDSGVYFGLNEGMLSNEVVLMDDISITFDGYKQICLTSGGRFTLNGHTLTLIGTTVGCGIENCQKLFDNDEDHNIIGYTPSGDRAIVTQDLIYSIETEYAPFMFNLCYYYVNSSTKWTCTESFTIGGYATLDAKTMAQAPIKMGEYSLEVGESKVLAVEAISGAEYNWLSNGGMSTPDYYVSFVESDTHQSSITIYGAQGSPMGGDLNRIIACDVFKQDGSWQRYYWEITIPGDEDMGFGGGPVIPGVPGGIGGGIWG